MKTVVTPQGMTQVPLSSAELAQQAVDAAAAAAQAPNAALLAQINTLAAKITDRMRNEAATGSALTGLGADKSQTAAQYITAMLSQIESLRVQLR